MESKAGKWLEERAQEIGNIWEGYVFAKIRNCECESPIEELFLVEWYFQNEIYDTGYSIKSQYKINDYRVDFMISTPHKENILIVELDSYLWHGSKPEQFAKEKERERELRREGWDIIRFSGREIYKDVINCVYELIEYLENMEEKEG